VKIVEQVLDTIRPKFEKGGPFQFAFPLFEAMESFFFASGEVTRGKVHVRDGLDSKRFMITVVVALIPCTLMAIYNTGMQRLAGLGMKPDIIQACLYGMLAFAPLYIVTMTVGLFWELLFCSVRHHEVNEGFFVTGLLFPLILPPTIPLWQVAVAISFGVIIGKEVFGGTGMNILNPALTARAFLFFSYPGNISGSGIWTFIDKTKEKLVDGYTAATPLGVSAAAEKGTSVVSALTSAGYTFKDLFLGTVPGSIGETSTLACLIGAVILIFTRIGSWRTMAGCVLGALGVSVLLYAVSGPESNPMFGIPPYYHLVMGGFAFGTVFMATDPVTSAATKTGKWIYGIGIGALAICIRSVNPAYPEGMMLAILLMNVFAPVIDHFIAQSNIKRRLNRGTR
jgi:Na+-transporting NADH:ubiquinone oxidoreductase subunit B